VYSDHKAVDISGPRVTGTMRHGALESPFDGEPCVKASFVGAFVITDRPSLCLVCTHWHKEREAADRWCEWGEAIKRPMQLCSVRDGGCCCSIEPSLVTFGSYEIHSKSLKLSVPIIIK